jgi:hypothetical protein
MHATGVRGWSPVFRITKDRYTNGCHTSPYCGRKHRKWRWPMVGRTSKAAGVEFAPRREQRSHRLRQATREQAKSTPTWRLSKVISQPSTPTHMLLATCCPCTEGRRRAARHCSPCMHTLADSQMGDPIDTESAPFGVACLPRLLLCNRLLIAA